ncbi:MAG TPA: SDR family NAD(P)-dependent oxidoreductase [Bryobacteraceae bacterium]|nr:SDR family NAD(P)-dependent oxidoreductase [Bryobacteraceae bacterium]
MKLTDKVCLITGGSGGIGSATAIELARRGADIAISGLPRDADAAESVRAAVENLRVSCICISGDVGEPGEAARAVKETVEAFGRLDVLIHCAGGAAPGGLMEVCPEDWYRAFDVHVHAIFHLCRAAVPYMIERQEGAIVLISSAAGSRGCAGAIAYGVAKGAVPQFARSLARELAEHNIRVNAVAPGVIRTRFQDHLTPEQVRQNIENRIPLRREGKPEDVAAAIVMLVENDFISGENVAIDGGMTMRIA